MEKAIPINEWQRVDSQLFWEDIAPSDHVVQIYEKDGDLLDLLENYVSGGIKANASIIIIATKAHLEVLDARLQTDGLNISELQAAYQYIRLEVSSCLSQFMEHNIPNETLFTEFVSGITAKARQGGREIRVFGEMVAVLWASGNTEATILLEKFWNKFCKIQSLCLFCAYPKSSLIQSPSSSVMDICCSHTKMVTGKNNSKTEMFYKDTAYKKVFN